MSINIGKFTPVFRIKLNLETGSPLVFYAANSGIRTGHFLDSTYSNPYYNAVATGVQYNIKIVPEQFYSTGIIPSVSLSTSNTGIATINQSGNTTYIGTGNFNVIASYTSNFVGQSVVMPINNYSGSGVSTSVFNYSPDPINVSQHVLIAYNTNSNTSIGVMNYYTGHRPLFSGANVIGLSVPSGNEQIDYPTFSGSIQTPIFNFITGVSGKPIRYVIMLNDIATRVSGTAGTNIYSLPYQLYWAYQYMGIRSGLDYSMQTGHFSLANYQADSFLVSYINFTNYADSIAYINRISVGQTGLYLTGNGGNTGFYIDDAGAFSGYYTYFSGRNLQPLLQAYPSTPYVYRAYNQSQITTGSNLAGYISWGNDGGLGLTYPTDGTIKWGGNSNWYIMMTVDSFDGRTGGFNTWFTSGAFGGLNGTGYNNCPVGAIGTVEEPFLGSHNLSGYFNMWVSGYPFIECAWQSRLTPWLAVYGDPFIHI